MKKEQLMVETFHRTFDIPVNDRAVLPNAKDWALRERLIFEEFKELRDAYKSRNLTLIADGLADLLYVILGTAVTAGIDIEEVFHEVHLSNMSKVGGHKDEGGKWIKPSTYKPADLKPIVNRMQRASENYDSVLHIGVGSGATGDLSWTLFDNPAMVEIQFLQLTSSIDRDRDNIYVIHEKVFADHDDEFLCQLPWHILTRRKNIWLPARIWEIINGEK